MWNVNNYDLSMAEGDYGISLPIMITGTTLGNNDSIRLTFKNAKNGTAIMTKEYTGITNNTVSLELTEAESALFAVGIYAYGLDWYQDGNFMCNLIEVGAFKVVKKA